MPIKVKNSPTATVDQDIGRPATWREGRYLMPGQPVDRSVEPVARQASKRDKISTRVTKKDYESLEKPAPGAQKAKRRPT